MSEDSEALLTWVTLQIPFQWPYTEDGDPWGSRIASAKMASTRGSKVQK